MDKDDNVLIGKALWNKIGQADNTYDDLLNIFDNVGKSYIEKIKKEYLGI